MSTLPTTPAPLFVTAGGVRVYGTPAAMGRAGWALREMLADVETTAPKPAPKTTGEKRHPRTAQMTATP